MIGIVLVTHPNLGTAFIETVETILDNKLDKVTTVSIDLKEDVDVLRNKISTSIESVKTKDGVMLLTDMFGGTPSNLSYSFLKKNEIEVLSGVNLPMFLKAIFFQNKDEKVGTVVKKIEKLGKQSISVASTILDGKKRI